MVRLDIVIPEAQKKRLQRIADESNVSLGMVVRKAIESALKQRPKKVGLF